MGKQKTAVYLNICTILGLAAMALFIWYGIRTGIFVSAEALDTFLGRFGLWAPVCFVLIQCIQVVIPILPGAIGCLGGVLIFGPVWGFVYNYVGICAGSILAFQISRKFGMPVVERVAGNQKIGRYLKWMDSGVFDRLFAAAIFFPASPDDLLCFLAGVTRMRFRKFLLIIFLGKPLSIAVYSLGLTVVFDHILRMAG